MKQNANRLLILGVTATVLALSACAPVRDYSPDPPAPTPVELSNPISDETSLLAEVQLSDGVTLTVNQVGVGYKTSTQVEYWDTLNIGQEEVAEEPVESEPAETEESEAAVETLINNTRVVALTYTLTNNSNSEQNIISFDYRSGYYLTGNLETEYAYYDETENSLHAKVLNIPTYPEGWDINLEEYILQPGESATWALDWGMPGVIPESGTLTFSQNFLYKSVWYSDILLDLNLYTGEDNE